MALPKPCDMNMYLIEGRGLEPAVPCGPLRNGLLGSGKSGNREPWFPFTKLLFPKLGWLQDLSSQECQRPTELKRYLQLRQGKGGQTGLLIIAQAGTWGHPQAFHPVFSPSAKFQPPHQCPASAQKLIRSMESRAPPGQSTWGGALGTPAPPQQTHVQIPKEMQGPVKDGYSSALPQKPPPACNYIECLLFRALRMLLSPPKQAFPKFPNSAIPEIGLQRVLLDFSFHVIHVG